MKLFDIFIVHCFKDDKKALENVIANANDGCAIIVISHDPKALNSLSVENQLPNKITAELKIISVDKLQKIHSN
jgi:copper chaperone CopZ